MEAGIKENRSLERGARGCLVEVISTVLAVVVMLVISANYRDFDDKFACGGGLGAGFPVSFLCDYGAGGSPISSWGRIDLSDFPYFSLQGLAVDILFYAGILLIGWLVRHALRQNDSYPVANTLWVAVIGIAFLLGFLSASAIFKSDRINFYNYLMDIPTPAPPTSTPFGTPPPPEWTPIPTLGP
jgi:hypothetical protein